MGISPLLVVDTTNASPQVHRLINGSGLESVTLGGPYTGGVAEITDANRQRQMYGRVCEFNNDLYLCEPAGNTVRRFNTGTLDWDTVYTPTRTLESNLPSMTGCWITASVNGVLTLFFFYKHNTANTIEVLYTTDGTTWNQGLTGPLTGGGNPYGGIIYYRGFFYIGVRSGTPSVLAYDPIADNWTSFGAAFAGTTTPYVHQWVIFNGRLLGFVSNGSSTGAVPCRLFERSGPGFAEIPLATLNAAMIGGSSAAMAAFSQSGNVYVVLMQYLGTSTNANNGLRVLELVPSGGSFTDNDITATVVPAFWQPGGGAGAAGEVFYHSQIYLYAEEDDTPGTPQFFFWTFAQTNSATSGFWTWLGGATPMALPAAGPGVQYALPVNNMGDGFNSYTVGDNSIEIFNVQSFSNRVDVDFRVGGTGATKSVRLYYNLGEGLPVAVATLTGSPSVVSGPSPAPGRTGNVLTTVTPDDMATIYRFSWDAPTDGLTEGSFFSLKAELF